MSQIPPTKRRKKENSSFQTKPHQELLHLVVNHPRCVQLAGVDVTGDEKKYPFSTPQMKRMLNFISKDELLPLFKKWLICEGAKNFTKEFIVNALTDLWSGYSDVRKRYLEKCHLKELGGNATQFAEICGICVPIDILSHIFSHLTSKELLYSIGSTNSILYLMVLSTWKGKLVLRKSNLFQISLLVLKSIETIEFREKLTKSYIQYLFDRISLHKIRRLVFKLYNPWNPEIRDFLQTPKSQGSYDCEEILVFIQKNNLIFPNVSKIEFGEFGKKKYFRSAFPAPTHFPSLTFLGLKNNYQAYTSFIKPRSSMKKRSLFENFSLCPKLRSVGFEWFGRGKGTHSERVLDWFGFDSKSKTGFKNIRKLIIGKNSTTLTKETWSPYKELKVLEMQTLEWGRTFHFYNPFFKLPDELELEEINFRNAECYKHYPSFAKVVEWIKKICGKTNKKISIGFMTKTKNRSTRLRFRRKEHEYPYFCVLDVENLVEFSFSRWFKFTIFTKHIPIYFHDEDDLHRSKKDVEVVFDNLQKTLVLKVFGNRGDLTHKFMDQLAEKAKKFGVEKLKIVENIKTKLEHEKESVVELMNSFVKKISFQFDEGETGFEMKKHTGMQDGWLYEEEYFILKRTRWFQITK